ncbi:MAG: hypothetical protein J5766_02010, partial [Clostridia bacterium]|nr:hypothetical protein [Clostridia bacterium]
MNILDENYVASGNLWYFHNTTGSWERDGSEEYKGVKGKFFETVYGMIDRKDGAKPVADQMADIRKNYEEYFEAEQSKQKPNFGAPV